MNQASINELRLLLGELARNASVQVRAVIAQTSQMGTVEAFDFIRTAYPELLTPYLSAAADLSATWYEELVPQSRFVAASTALPTAERLSMSAAWALSQSASALLLEGSAVRALFDSSRDTILDNADAEGVRWARHASANACAFCMMLATRGAVYRSDRTAMRSHDNCHCLAVPDRDGSYEPAPYMAKAVDDYEAARKAGARTESEIVAAMSAAAAERKTPA